MSDSNLTPKLPQRDALFAEICSEHTGLIARITYAFAEERVDRDDLGSGNSHRALGSDASI